MSSAARVLQVKPRGTVVIKFQEAIPRTAAGVSGTLPCRSHSIVFVKTESGCFKIFSGANIFFQKSPFVRFIILPFEWDIRRRVTNRGWNFKRRVHSSNMRPIRFFIDLCIVV